MFIHYSDCANQIFLFGIETLILPLSSSPGIALARSCLSLLATNCLEWLVKGWAQKPGLALIQTSLKGYPRVPVGNQVSETFVAKAWQVNFSLCPLGFPLCYSIPMSPPHYISCMLISVSVSMEPHLRCPSLNQSLRCSRQIRAHH